MKKTVSIVFMLLLMMSVACARDKITRDVSLLPTEAHEMMKAYSPNKEISYLKIDKNLFWIEGYEVKLSDGSELDFDIKGQWTEVDCHSTTVPDKLIPEPIRMYIKRYYSDQTVKKIKHNRRGYELKMGNSLELKFDNTGGFLRFDD